MKNKAFYAFFSVLTGLTLFVVVLYNKSEDSRRTESPSPSPSKTKTAKFFKNAPSSPTKPSTGNEKILLVFWSGFFGMPAGREGSWEKGDETGKCPVACEITSQRSRARQANAFIVHAWDRHQLPPNKSVPWVLLSQENPLHAPALSDAGFMRQFHLYMSYRLDSDFPHTMFLKPNLEPPLPFKNKTGNIMAVFTNCEPVRTEYLKQLMKFIPVDSYGGCLKNKPGLVARYGKDFKGEKKRLLKSYKFLTVFFNQDCDYFVDDRILHALNAGVVPVVMATDKIRDFLPGNLKSSFINVRDFEGPKQLADYLRYAGSNEAEYNKYLEWKTKGLGDISDSIIGKYWTQKYNHWCYVCVEIAHRRWHKEGLKADICEPRKYSTWGITPGA